jgi:hypothetical protein
VEWLSRYLRLQKRYDTSVRKLLREALDDAELQLVNVFPAGVGIGARVSDAQARQAIAAIQGTLSYFWRNLGDTVKAGYADAAKAAVEQSFSWDDVLLRRAIPSATVRAAMRDGLAAAAMRNVESAIVRVYKTRIPLSVQVYKTRALADGWVERRINSALARGLTAREMASEVKAFIRPETPGGLSYASMRLARTEINAAYHATSIVHNEDKPWNQGMHWRLSGSHPRLDECDLYAERSPFPRGEVPAKPHPQCLCVVYPAMPSQEDFIRKFHAGDYDQWLSSTSADPLR